MRPTIRSSGHTSGQIIRVADALALSVPQARGLCAGAFTVSVICLAYSATRVLPSAAFQSFAIPAIFGAFMSVMILGGLLAELLKVEGKPALDASTRETSPDT